MKLFTKVISALGMCAGVLFLVQKAISWGYENAEQKYVTFDSEDDQP